MLASYTDCNVFYSYSVLGRGNSNFNYKNLQYELRSPKKGDYLLDFVNYLPDTVVQTSSLLAPSRQ